MKTKIDELSNEVNGLFVLFHLVLHVLQATE